MRSRRCDQGHALGPHQPRSTASSPIDGDLDKAVAGQSVTLTLEDEIDVSRGDVICAATDPLGVADQFEARILWMGDEPMLPGRPYLIKIGTRTVQGALESPEIQGQRQHARACRGEDA